MFIYIFCNPSKEYPWLAGTQGIKLRSMKSCKLLELDSGKINNMDIQANHAEISLTSNSKFRKECALNFFVCFCLDYKFYKSRVGI